MQDDDFGPRLRAERERRRITLESIAANTKISISLLRDLERDRMTRWPGGIFRRSFIRSYATAVGLDPDETLQQFLERYPAPANDADAGATPVPPASPRQRVPMLRLTLADESHMLSRSAVLHATVGRLLAAACDVSLPLLLAAVVYLAIGTFWAPFAVAMVCYLVGGIMVLGTTPGVYLRGQRKRSTLVRPPVESSHEAGHLSRLEESLSR